MQLLGSIDDFVSPDDNIDLATGSTFLYLDVPKSGHGNVIDLDETDAGLLRQKIFKTALIESEAAIRAQSILPTDPTLAQSRPDVTNVVFVIHGIRDEGFWTHKIARRIIALGQSPPRIYASATAKYGYFPMLPFLLPSRRREKVAWLMDQYVEAKALYPNAKLSYVGHSQGTFLLADALKNYRACKFDNIVFAGSVVRKSYNWRRALVERKQITSILNYVATGDWVVAWFPGALEKLHLQDVGTGGHNGFEQYLEVPGLHERRFIPGRHAAALTEDNWDDIAHFIVNGQPATTSAVELADARGWFVVGVGLVAPLLWLVLAALVCLGGWGVWRVPSHEWAKTLAVVVYAMLVWRVVSWF